MKKLPALIMMALLFAGCKEQETKENDPAEKAEEHNEAKFSRPHEKDAQFMVDATVFSMEQLRLSQLAKKQGISKEAKELATKMEKDHEGYLKELRKLAEAKTITVPDSLSEEPDEEETKLMSRSGKEFDEAFCKRISKDHKEMIRKFEKASTDAEDYEIKSLAEKILPDLRKHLDEAMLCHEEEKK